MDVHHDFEGMRASAIEVSLCLSLFLAVYLGDRRAPHHQPPQVNHFGLNTKRLFNRTVKAQPSQSVKFTDRIFHRR